MRGVQVLEGAFNPEAPQRLGEFIQQYKPSFPVGLVDPNFVSNYAQLATLGGRIPKVPLLFFIDRKGVIRAQFFGDDPLFMQGDPAANIRAEIDKLLKEGAPLAAKPHSKNTRDRK
jgi:hypothetical protein